MKISLKILSTLALAVTILLLGAINCRAQYFEEPLKFPLKYSKPTIETQSNTGMAREFSQREWRVWADRAGIVTSNGQKPSFMEEFLVVEEKEDALHVVKDNGSYDPIEGVFSTNTMPIDYGWIPKKYLVLWFSSMFDSETNFREKVLTISDVEHMAKTKDRIMQGEKLMEYYASPTTSVPLDLETPIFEVFYVYKKSRGRALIGKVEDLAMHKAKNVIHGWVDLSIVQTWGHRQTLEPNSSTEVASKRKAKQVEASLFANAENTQNYISNPQDNDFSFWSNDQYEKGYDNQWYRMPILSTNGDIIQTAVISDLFSVKNEDGKATMDTIDTETVNQYKKRYEEQKMKTSRINMVFVIDATKSMEKPIESVKKAVIQTASRLNSSINKFEFGVIVYRDYINANDESCFEVHKLGDYKQFYNFMNTVRTDDPACFNNTISEGMYKGLLMSKSLFRGKEQETNVIVLVGDAGDRKESWRVGEDEVVRMLVQNSVSLITIQAHKWSDKAYTDFITQTRALSLKSATQMSENQKRLYGSTNLTSKTTTPKFRKDLRGNRTLYNLEDSPVDGALQYASSGTEIPAATIESEVGRIIREIDSSNTALLASLDIIVNGSLDSLSFDPEVIQALIKAGFDANFIELLSTKRYQFMMGGFTASKVDMLTDNIYKYVLFLDQQELDGMAEILNKLVVPGRTSYERREGLYNAFLKLLTVNYGVPVSDVDGMNLKEIMGLITGLPSTSPLLDLKVAEIRDQIAMPDARLNEVIMHIKSSREQLVRVRATEKYSFNQDLKRYFWLPQEILP